ncbi:MAG: hypothetical protein ABIG63_16895 [Chloroflexota bacterium]
MNVLTTRRIEDLFSSLKVEEKVNIISQGVVLRLSDLRKRLDMAENRVRQLEEKYGVSLASLEADGLPNDADFEMHEDYILWHHWVEVIEQAKVRISALEKIAQQGLYLGESLRVSY